MTRGELMSRIRSRGNASTELAMMAVLRRRRVTGWRRHAKMLGIRPDFVFRKTKIAVFVDGCFWHGCVTHCRVDRLKPYWQTKITMNTVRDRTQEILLRHNGWKVVRIWEHDLRKGGPNGLVPVAAVSR